MRNVISRKTAVWGTTRRLLLYLCSRFVQLRKLIAYMQKLYSTLVLLFVAIAMMAQGWPENYKGVMLQGFYWDGYADSKWTVLESQADELSQYFSLIWVPQSGKTSEYYHSKRQTMGYDPCFWLDHNSCWGTEAELKKMIKTFSDKGTGIIEDVVINHKNGLNTLLTSVTRTAIPLQVPRIPVTISKATAIWTTPTRRCRRT